LDSPLIFIDLILFSISLDRIKAKENRGVVNEEGILKEEGIWGSFKLPQNLALENFN
jgi:hypothetical protein